MTTHNNVLKGEPEDSYGVSLDAWIKYQMDHNDPINHTDEEKMATYIDALNGDHTDGNEQFPQMDSVKRAGLEHSIAAKLLDVVSQDDLEDSYYEMQLEWAESMPDDELKQTAKELGIEF